MRKLLWIGDAGCPSGFARCTHEILRSIDYREKPGGTWDVTVIGINYRGDPDVRRKYPYDIFPASVNGSDIFGISRLEDLLPRIGPDLIVLQNDPWNIPRYALRLKNYNLVGALAVDGGNCRGTELNSLALSIFWTEFAFKQAAIGGYKGEGTVIPLGIDLANYKPQDRQAARKIVFGKDYPRFKDAFIVGNINRNQPRKRLDLSIAYFAEWVRTKRIDDAYLYLHVAPTGDQGYDCRQLAAYFGVANRLVLAEPEVWYGVEEEFMARTYACFDVMATTSQGEGWGLTTMEGMACGIPQIVGDWAALGEWTEDAALKVPCSEICVTPNRINSIGAVPDRAEFIRALDDLYSDPGMRESLGAKGLELVRRPEYQWDDIGVRYAHALDHVLETKAAAPAQAQEKGRETVNA